MLTYEERLAVNANGTVNPSANPIITSLTISPYLECSSIWLGIPLFLRLKPTVATSEIGSGSNVLSLYRS